MGSAPTTTAGPTAACQPSAVPVAEPASAPEAPRAVGRLLELQQLAGNRAVSAAVRLSLPIGIPGGDGERDADAVAAGARVSGPRIGATRRVSVPASLVDVVRSGVGRPIDPATTARMEPQLKTALGDVRIHTSALAAASAHDLGAAAYTIGDDIVFAAGRFGPATRSGSRLLAHEVAHVAQQRANGVAVIQLQPADKLEELGGPTETAAAAARRRLTVRSLSLLRAHNRLFSELPSHATPPDAARLTRLLDEAEDAGLHLGETQLAEIGKRLGKTRSPGDLDEALGAL